MDVGFEPMKKAEIGEGEVWNDMVKKKTPTARDVTSTSLAAVFFVNTERMQHVFKFFFFELRVSTRRAGSWADVRSSRCCKRWRPTALRSMRISK